MPTAPLSHRRLIARTARPSCRAADPTPNQARDHRAAHPGGAPNQRTRAGATTALEDVMRI